MTFHYHPLDPALAARLAALVGDETLTAHGRCPEKGCRYRLDLEVGALTYLEGTDDDGRGNAYGNSTVHPAHPESEGRRWTGTASYLSPNAAATYSKTRPRCPEHGYTIVFADPKPRKAPGERKPARPPAQRLGLPRIVRFDGKHDSGEFGNATCPHCGAEGRYVYSFLCEDGTKRGAMAGCIKLFPVSQIAKEHQAILEKEQDRSKKGWSLASWDVDKLAAIEAFYAGTATEGDALRTIAEADSRRRAYVARRYGRR